MKASVTFREEKSPLIRMKFPVTLAGFSLTSGIALGDNQDLALHLGTPSEAYPSVKIVYQPNLPSSPLCLVLKAGIGPWGPPRSATLSVSAQLRFSRVSSGPFFTMHIKPRLGDFSLRKMAKPVSLRLPVDVHKSIEDGRGHSHSHNHSHGLPAFTAPMAMAPVDKSRPSTFDDADAVHKAMAGSSDRTFDDAHAITPLKLEKGFLFTPMPYCHPSFRKSHSGISAETEIVDSWGSDYVKVDSFDHDNMKSHNDKKPNFDSFKDNHSEVESPLSASIGGGSLLNEQETEMVHNNGESVPVPWRLGVDESIRGWSLHAHSSLPLGKQATLNIRWGVKPHCDFMQSWESNLASIKLPYLYLQKISLVTPATFLETCNQASFSEAGQLELLAQDEEIHELSPVAALCGSMKRQLQLLYAENQVLKKAMEEMKSQFEQRSSGKTRRPAGTIGDVFVEEQNSAGAKLLDHAPGVKGGSKDRKDTSAKDQRDGVGVVSEKTNHALGLDAPKMFGGLGTVGSNGKFTSTRTMLD